MVRDIPAGNRKTLTFFYSAHCFAVTIEWVPSPIQVLTFIDKASTCHTEKRITKREEREIAIMTVLYDGRAWVTDSFDSNMVVFFLISDSFGLLWHLSLLTKAQSIRQLVEYKKGRTGGPSN